MIRDPFTKTETEKAAFYRPGEEWREVFPAGFKAITPDAAQLEREYVREVRRLIAIVDPVCLVCDRVIPAHEPDYLLTHEETGDRGFVCLNCNPPQVDVNGASLRVKYRPGLAGEELSEDEYRARAAHVRQSEVVENDMEGE